ncbi:hypothetical protein EDB84DRAFT_1518163, partial [Lactarius hengduanensis]
MRSTRSKAGGGRVQATRGARPATGADAQRTGQSRRREGTATRGARPAMGADAQRTGQSRRREASGGSAGDVRGRPTTADAACRQRTGQSRRWEGASNAWEDVVCRQPMGVGLFSHPDDIIKAPDQSSYLDCVVHALGEGVNHSRLTRLWNRMKPIPLLSCTPGAQFEGDVNGCQGSAP